MLATKPDGLRGQSQRDRAFTLSDLITVLAVVSILTMLQLLSAATTRGKGQSASCLYNHRKLVRAWQLYADENGGRLVGNFDGANVMNPANRDRTWVLGWFDFNGGLPAGATTNTLYLTAYSPLAPYLNRQAEVFKCPVDTSLSFGGRGVPRVRSVSMNSYLGERGERAGSLTAGYYQFRKISEIVKPKPSQAFVFIDEREDSINDGILFIDMTGYDPRAPGSYRIVDYPADWHNRGVNLSFVDGHTETWRWRDRRTMPRHVRGVILPLNTPSPNNPDVGRIQEATTSKLN